MNDAGITALATSFLAWAINIGFALLFVGELLTLWRAARGPQMADRVLALANSWLIGIGLLVLMALKYHNWRMLDVALALALLIGIVPLSRAWSHSSAPDVIDYSSTEHPDG